MRRFLFKFLFAIAAVLLCTTPASADTSCGVGSICTVTLTQTNVTQLAGVVVTVTIDNTGANTVLSFQLTTNPISSTNNALGIDFAAWNIAGTNPTFPTGTWSAQGTNNMDGFGSFTERTHDTANSLSLGGITSPVVFVLNGLYTNFPANASGNEFAVHIRWDNNCSGFIGGQVGTTSVSSNPNCGTPIPEPGTLALFGTGMLGLAGVIRRRLVA